MLYVMTVEVNEDPAWDLDTVETLSIIEDKINVIYTPGIKNVVVKEIHLVRDETLHPFNGDNLQQIFT